MKEIYEKFRCGDHVTTSEMNTLLGHIYDAIPYLESSLDFALALLQARRDRDDLEKYIAARMNK